MLRHALLVALIALPSAPSFAQNSAPGTYKDWNKVDAVEIVQSFKFADFAKVVVLPLETSGIKLPAESDNTYAPTKAMVEGSDAHFIDGLRKSIYDFRKDFTVEQGTAAPTDGAKVLLVRGKLLTLDPGSKAARAFAGFGAGAAKAKIEIELVDASTGTVLARMTHERRSGTGNFGGAYDKVMSQSLNEVGQTFGKGLKGF
ncbi:MAG: DUF4410 domain-containing protein [Phycisphaerae bacterium]|nr:DUF4410 domain-containing protein [Gemmatimonadaceae bacterium]